MIFLSSWLRLKKLANLFFSLIIIEYYSFVFNTTYLSAVPSNQPLVTNLQSAVISLQSTIIIRQ